MFFFFVLIVAFGPLFFSPLSEVYGRAPVIQIANLWYLGIRFVCLLDVNQ
jgi:MFS family permease